MSEAIEHVSSVDDLTAAAKPLPQINFVANTSTNAKAPTHFALIDAGYPFVGCVHSFAVYVKDNVPTCTVPNNYGNPPLQPKRVGPYAVDEQGQAAVSGLDAAVRIAFYGWKRDKTPQPFVL